jgi:hypothetical protein
MSTDRSNQNQQRFERSTLERTSPSIYPIITTTTTRRAKAIASTTTASMKLSTSTTTEKITTAVPEVNIEAEFGSQVAKRFNNIGYKNGIFDYASFQRFASIYKMEKRNLFDSNDNLPNNGEVWLAYKNLFKIISEEEEKIDDATTTLEPQEKEEEEEDGIKAVGLNNDYF